CQQAANGIIISACKPPVISFHLLIDRFEPFDYLIPDWRLVVFDAHDQNGHRLVNSAAPQFQSSKNLAHAFDLFKEVRRPVLVRHQYGGNNIAQGGVQVAEPAANGSDLVRHSPYASCHFGRLSLTDYSR